jgi:hypothetical protein
MKAKKRSQAARVFFPEIICLRVVQHKRFDNKYKITILDDNYIGLAGNYSSEFSAYGIF